MKNIELLSPARDADTGIGAVDCGADAIYIGAGKFGARKDAGNDIKEIERLIRYAHLFRVRVYLTLNTILTDLELEEATQMIYKAWNSGIDGLILQDMGLLECNLPPIPLIASTQTDNRTSAKVKFLEDCGFSRVILARELSIDEIKFIRSQTNVELESFIHGALCVSYSGQCWASAAVTDRSANRGECAQICRSSFDLEDARGNKIINDKHLLSLKDLNLSSYIKCMLDAGISSFKIEGRLKDINYVKNITSFYRSKIDEVLEGSDGLKRTSAGKSKVNFIADPQKTFNRGYTSHFINDRQPELSSYLTQKSIGKYVGTIAKSSHELLLSDMQEAIHNGDGLCYFDKTDHLTGFLVNNSEGNRITPNTGADIPPGTRLYRNLDLKFQQQLEGKSACRKIDASAFFEETATGFRLRIEDEDGYHAEAYLNIEKVMAKNHELATASVKQQVAKSGDTVFGINQVMINWSTAFFIATGLLNGLRREVLELLQKLRQEGYKRVEKQRVDSYSLYPQNTLDYKANILNAKSREFYSKHGVNSFEDALELKFPDGNPRLMTTRYCIKFELGICMKKQKPAEGTKYTEPYFLRDAKRRYRLEFDCKACEMNLYLEGNI